MEVSFSPTFIRMLKGLPQELQEETIEKVELFKKNSSHTSLKVHKLQGRLKGRYSFSVNYHIRIVFTYLKPRSVYLLAIGDHDIYRI